MKKVRIYKIQDNLHFKVGAFRICRFAKKNSYGQRWRLIINFSKHCWITLFGFNQRMYGA